MLLQRPGQYRRPAMLAGRARLLLLLGLLAPPAQLAPPSGRQVAPVDGGGGHDEAARDYRGVLDGEEGFFVSSDDQNDAGEGSGLDVEQEEGKDLLAAAVVGLREASRGVDLEGSGEGPEDFPTEDAEEDYSSKVVATAVRYDEADNFVEPSSREDKEEVRSREDKVEVRSREDKEEVRNKEDKEEVRSREDIEEVMSKEEVEVRNKKDKEERREQLDQWVKELRFHSGTIATTTEEEESTAPTAPASPTTSATPTSQATTTEAEMATDPPDGTADGKEAEGREELFNLWLTSIREQSKQVVGRPDDGGPRSDGQDLEADDRTTKRRRRKPLAVDVDATVLPSVRSSPKQEDGGDGAEGEDDDVGGAPDDKGLVRLDVKLRLAIDNDLFRGLAAPPDGKLQREERQIQTKPKGKKWAGGRRRQEAKPPRVKASQLRRRLQLDDPGLLRMTLEEGRPDLVEAAVMAGTKDNLRVAFTDSDPDILM